MTLTLHPHLFLARNAPMRQPSYHPTGYGPYDEFDLPTPSYLWDTPHSVPDSDITPYLTPAQRRMLTQIGLPSTALNLGVMASHSAASTTKNNADLTPHLQQFT